MFDVERERIPGRIELVTTWLPRIAVAIFFGAVGSSKFRDPMWVHLFDRIGLGQWFRVLTGVLQLSAAVLTLIPRTSLLGIGLAGCTLAGAVLAWLTVLGNPFTAVIPGLLLIVLVVIGVGEYSRYSSRSATSGST